MFAAWMIEVRRPLGRDATLMPSPPPEPHLWTRSYCVLLLPPLAGEPRPALTHGAPSPCARVGCGPSHCDKRHDKTRRRRLWTRTRVQRRQRNT